MTKANYERIRLFITRRRVWISRAWLMSYMGLDPAEIDSEKPKY